MSEDFYCEQVISQKLKVKKVLETENILAYHHTQPFWETHIVIIPKKHIASLLTLEKTDEPLLLELLEVIRHVAGQVVKEKGAARVLTNLGLYQDSKHLHFHVNSGAQIRF
jgi:histidine triad (HIT) family protein